MRRLRLTLAAASLALVSLTDTAAASNCPNIFTFPGGFCSMTGRTQGCACEYDCVGTEETPTWFSFC